MCVLIVVGTNRGRPGPEPAGWTGAVVPSPPPPPGDVTTPCVASFLFTSVACYRRTSWHATQLPNHPFTSTERIGELPASISPGSSPTKPTSKQKSRGACTRLKVAAADRRTLHVGLNGHRVHRWNSCLPTCLILRVSPRVLWVATELSGNSLGDGDERGEWHRHDARRGHVIRRIIGQKFRFSANIRCTCACSYWRGKKVCWECKYVESKYAESETRKGERSHRCTAREQPEIRSRGTRVRSHLFFYLTDRWVLRNLVTWIAGCLLGTDFMKTVLWIHVRSLVSGGNFAMGATRLRFQRLSRSNT